MLEEVEALPIQTLGRRESSTSGADDTAVGQVASPEWQSFRSVSFVELRYTLPSHVDIISPFVDQLMRFISRYRGPDESKFEIDLALREALANAIVHGNLEDLHKRVYVKCRCTTDGEVSITVEDEGYGFKSDEVQDPSSPENRLHTCGQAIYLITMLMDELHFEQGGSVLHMSKRANGRPGAVPLNIHHFAEGAA
jgi:serine/threonine-protein kinase RsbW